MNESLITMPNVAYEYVIELKTIWRIAEIVWETTTTISNIYYSCKYLNWCRLMTLKNCMYVALLGSYQRRGSW